jgi:hypothetical protein
VVHKVPLTKGSTPGRNDVLHSIFYLR